MHPAVEITAKIRMTARRNARFLIGVELPAGTLYVSRIRVFEIRLFQKRNWPSDHFFGSGLHELPCDGGRIMAGRQNEVQLHVVFKHRGFYFGCEGDPSVGAVEVGFYKLCCVGKALHGDVVLFHLGKHRFFERTGGHGQGLSGHPADDEASAAFHVLAGGRDVFLGDGVDASVGEFEVFADSRLVEGGVFFAPFGKGDVEEPGLVCRDEHGEEFWGHCLKGRSVVAGVFGEGVEHDPLIREPGRQFVEGGFCVAGLGEVFAGGLDLFGFVGEAASDVEIDGFFEFFSEDVVTHFVGDGFEGAESLESVVVGDSCSDFAGDFSGVFCEIVRFAVPKGDLESVSKEVSKAEGELVGRDRFDGHVFDVEVGGGFGGDVVEGDVLGGDGVFVFGACPSDAFLADAQPVGDFVHGVLVFPGAFGEFADGVGAGVGEGDGQFFDDEVFGGGSETSADSGLAGGVVPHAEVDFEGVGGWFHVRGGGGVRLFY